MKGRSSACLRRASYARKGCRKVLVGFNQRRWISQSQYTALGLHEYQSQKLLKDNGVFVAAGDVASSADEAFDVASQLIQDGAKELVVKAQVLSGGRGLGHFEKSKSSGIRICTTAEEVRAASGDMIGDNLITKQTGEEGKPCNTVFVVERLFSDQSEKYLAILMDRASYGPVVIGSSQGGTNIETISEEYPDAIFKVPVDIETGIQDHHLDTVAEGLAFGGDEATKEKVKRLVKHLYNLFIEKDCSLAEINPLIADVEGRIMAVDAKFNFDDNAEFRQADIFEKRDFSQEDPEEVQAGKFDLNYIKLDGNIGCLVNGAGLAMATMDIISQKGGEAANFLDVGGGATENQVIEAFSILNSSPNVQAVLVNIFGGIMRCDIIASGIINAVKKLDMKLPLVVRLSGNKMEEAKALLENSGLSIIAADNLDEAATKACKVASVVQSAKELNMNVSFTPITK